VQDIEQVVAEAVAAAGAQVLLQGAEIGRAALALDDHLAIEQGGDDRQPLQRLLHRGKLCGPVEPAARL
jgi:hypothetical protein